ncbi:MAG: 16S rRNA (guanine(527)-N(7))-methyltransferase RsmG [Proteobacteria bacterium]|nr:16S rRNA (guanine(527)-N(7))-methyltransferase RsmG [Pseudomonadota bacterium]
MSLMTLPPEIAALRPTLESGLAELALAPALAAPLLDYLALLARWNRTYNLTAVRDPAKMVTLHLLDSLAMHGQLQPGALADLGTGPGLPGIPLALARPDVQVTLVESNGKKARFLREAVRSLGIANARVLESRAEAVAEPGAYRQITARALATLAGILEVGGHLLAPDGVLLAMKSGTTDEEGRELPAGWAIREVHPLRVPGLDARRELVVVGRA